jgi:hypothetical protein
VNFKREIPGATDRYSFLVFDSAAGPDAPPAEEGKEDSLIDGDNLEAHNHTL